MAGSPTLIDQAILALDSEILPVTRPGHRGPLATADNDFSSSPTAVLVPVLIPNVSSDDALASLISTTKKTRNGPATGTLLSAVAGSRR